MPHSRLFARVARTLKVAKFCEEAGVATAEGMERVAALEHAATRRPPSRRDFVKLAGAGAALLGLGLHGRVARAKQTSQARVAIVGGGMAGLACADRLQRLGVIARLYEANPGRLGGRLWSNRTTFPGQVDENGGEMIDNSHKTMLGYAQEFKLAREDYNKNPGETSYYFFGRSHSEADVVAELREFTKRAQPDLQSLSASPSALAHTDADVALDNTDLATFLATRAAGLPLAQAALSAAYISEYGREPAEQSCLNLLLFLHLDRRSRFEPYGHSDERWHIVGGNDQIVNGIRDRLTGPLSMGTTLERLSKNMAGEFELKFRGATQVERADAVVLALPFSVLRTVVLDASLGLSAAKINAIQKLGYGNNCKSSIGFNGRPWTSHGSAGDIYSDLANLQNTWETNWTRATSTSLLTDYAGGARAQRLQITPPAFCGSCHAGPPSAATAFDSPLLQSQTDAFLTDLDKVWPGAKAAASRSASGGYVIHRAHWQVQSYSRGSYTCYLPGQFTSIAGLEGQSAGALKFAGEHTDSFYEYQGFLEGAARSGLAAADDIIDDMMDGRL